MSARLAPLVVVCALLACVAAFAAEAAGWSDWLKPWWDMLTQGVIAGVIMLIAAGHKRWLGADLEERHRRALHSALTTGAEAAWEKVKSWRREGLSGPELEARLIAETIAHAEAGGAPDAMKAFALDAASPALIALATAKLKQTARPGLSAFAPPPEPAANAA